ncbi:MAG: hypothetical protein EZS28_023137 [Streblomastix strix]|uniref:Uncharacterized protein n=1 Tax=Streblomastix strix TaxID=222440 RepID=A0A5J4VG83_9EUKA|nr:MAG: hypothetical protein EZS28_023137 [Streblomastix strix]
MKNKNNWDSFVLTGCNADPADRDGIIAPIPTPPVEQAIKQSLVRGMYESFAWGQVTTYNGRTYISLQITHSNPNTQTQSTYKLFNVFKDEAKPQFTDYLTPQIIGGTLKRIIVKEEEIKQQLCCRSKEQRINTQIIQY